MASQAQLGGSRRSGANIVRLDGTGDQNRIGILRQSLAQTKFKLPDLVATEGQPGGVVSFYLELEAQLISQPWRRLQGGWVMAQGCQRESIQQTGNLAGRHHVIASKLPLMTVLV
jgi:hypothetical protein